MIKPIFQSLPLGSIKPIGWLKKQLEIQANGLTGNLEEVWEDVGPNSGWLGGTGEDWERGPYYCDGLVPLAYILNEKDLIGKARKWIEWTLNSQQSDGFFGPRNNKDWWPRMVMLKVITQYHEATEDDRVVPFLKKYFKYQLKNIKSQPLENWAKARGFENVLSVLWLYEKTKDDFLIELVDELFEQSLDWSSLFENFPYKKPTRYYLNWQKFLKFLSVDDRDDINLEKLGISEEEAAKLFYTYHTTHVVNIAMAFKEPALKYLRYGTSKYKELAVKAIKEIMKYHGMPNGMFSGDEHLNGKNPTQGTELCAVVEYMFSLENLFRILGYSIFGDILERVAYNALPATIKPDFCAHQYDQQINQVICNVAPRDWYNNGDDSNIFGLEPNFGCCTANMHQGWPKFVENLWMKSKDDVFVSVAYAPCELNYEFPDGAKLTIVEETEYPFDDEINVVVLKDGHDVNLKLRIPEWTNEWSLSVNGENLGSKEKNGFIEIRNLRVGKNEIRLKFIPEVKTSCWYKDAISVERGPLIFGLKIKENWKKIARQEPFADYEVYPETPWNYALDVSAGFKVEKLKIVNEPFSPTNPPMKIHTKGIRIKDWNLVNNSAGPIPKIGKETALNDVKEDIQLIPYGCTNLRIAEFPQIRL